MTETIPAIDAAYVWTVASDFRASNAIADAATITAHGASSITLVLEDGDLASLIAVVAMVDEDNPTIASYEYSKDDSNVAVWAHYRGVDMHAQAVFPADRAGDVVATLRGGAS